MSEGFGRRKKVLVIEDDKDTRASIVEILKVLGYDEVTAVADGAAAVSALVENPNGFPIAIIDIFLPDMTAKHMAGRFPSTHGIKTLILYSGGGGEHFAAVRAAFEKLGIPNVQSLKKPATLEKFEKLLS
ncbi:MAG: response regulator [Proteobacteria bacterium]|nr:response regulator [Pseudomonadota bacterium]